MEFDIHAIKKRITVLLISTVVFLHTLNLVVIITKYSKISFPLKKYFIILFQVNSEGKIPTWYSAVTLLFCALILTLISYLKRKERARYLIHWIGMATLFALMSLDEAMSIHEMSTAPLRNALNTTGVFYFAWVIPGLAFTATFVLMYLKFLIGLPRRTMHLFVAAGGIYILGVLGMELVGSAYTYYYQHNLIYTIFATIEEIFEMSGIVLFIYALLDYLEEYLKVHRLKLCIYGKKI